MIVTFAWVHKYKLMIYFAESILDLMRQQLHNVKNLKYRHSAVKSMTCPVTNAISGGFKDRTNEETSDFISD